MVHGVAEGGLALVRGGLKGLYYRIPLQFRYGRTFRERYRFLQESQWWSRDKLEEYQIDQLVKLVHHAYENVPYYRRIFDERGLRPRDIQDFNDLGSLPCLTKDQVRANLQDLIARDIPKENMSYVTTGGTGGKPLGLYIERNTGIRRLAFDWRQWNWMGYRFSDRCVVLRGNLVKARHNDGTSWWEYDREKKYLVLSSYDMADGNLPKYVQRIEEFRPKVIRGYPSTLEVLARFATENGLRINEKRNIKAIATSSENLYPAQRQLIEGVLRSPVFDLYGNSEQTVRLGECEKHEGYHVFTEYGYTEVLDKEGRPVDKEGGIGEIVGTGFTNYAVPLIRYRTEDFAVFTNRHCSCGRNGLPLLSQIMGRWYQERIITRKGNYIPITALNSHSDVFDNVGQYQYYQDHPNKLILRVVRKATYTDDDTRRILKELGSKLRNQIELEIQFPSEITRTKSGKYRYLVQKLPVLPGSPWEDPL